MPHVITQSCCSDGSCVYACPVNCIHPSPDEPGFATAEMLYIDPVACVDCGACVSACPVGAIAPDTRLDAEQLPFIALNAAFYPDRPAGEKLPPTSKLAPVIERRRCSRAARHPLTVAIVGSGPAAMYAADELLTQRGVRVNVFERLPTPYGLVRAGVAPDHQSTKRVTRLFDKIARRRGFRFYLNVEVGIGPESRRTAGTPSRRALRRRRPQRPPARHRRHGAAGHRHRHRDGGLDQRSSRIRRFASRSGPRAGGHRRQRQRRARRRPDPDRPIPMRWPAPTSPTTRWPPCAVRRSPKW